MSETCMGTGRHTCSACRHFKYRLDRKIAFAVAAVTCLFAAFMAGYAVGHAASPASSEVQVEEGTPEAPPALPVETEATAGNVTLAPEAPCTPWDPNSSAGAPSNPC